MLASSRQVHFHESGGLLRDPVGSSLLQATDGNLYYVLGTLPWDTILRVPLQGSGESLGNLMDGHGGYLIQASSGQLYGTTEYSHDLCGLIFTHQPGVGLTTLYSFPRGPGAPCRPIALIEGSDGAFFGVTAEGGASGRGTAFRITPQGVLTVLNDFASSPDSTGPVAGLLAADDGHFYGVTAPRYEGRLGTVFRMTSTGEVTYLHRFRGGPEGKYARHLVATVDGSLYGVTSAGGRYDLGTIFDGRLMARSPRCTTSRAATIGETPNALTLGSDGNLYGTTEHGGVADHGSVFRLTPQHQFATVHHFREPADGVDPSGLTQAADGFLYGTTRFGGFGGCGIAYKMSLDGEITILHHFLADGGPCATRSGLVQGADGNFFGVARQAVYRMTPAGTVTVLRSMFLMDGEYIQLEPLGLVKGIDGHLYLTIPAGISGYYSGEIFRITIAGVTRLLFQPPFSFGQGGPVGPFMPGADGHLYGTCVSSLPANVTSFCRLEANGTLTILRTFDQATEGALYRTALAETHGTMTRLGDGHFYGTTLTAGPFGAGTLYRIRAFPDRVSGVTVTPESDQAVRLAWSPSGASSYTIGRSDCRGSEVVIATGVTTTAFVDPFVERGARYCYVVTAVNAFGESVASHRVSITAGRPVVADVNHDLRSDVVVYRPDGGVWFVRQGMASHASTAAYRWGAATDVPVAGDFDGDGRMELTVFRPSTGEWYLRLSSTGYQQERRYVWGAIGDVPLAADFDGDGVTDSDGVPTRRHGVLFRWSLVRAALVRQLRVRPCVRVGQRGRYPRRRRLRRGWPDRSHGIRPGKRQTDPEVLHGGIPIDRDDLLGCDRRCAPRRRLRRRRPQRNRGVSSDRGTLVHRVFIGPVAGVARHSVGRAGRHAGAGRFRWRRAHRSHRVPTRNRSVVCPVYARLSGVGVGVLGRARRHRGAVTFSNVLLPRWWHTGKSAAT